MSRRPFPVGVVIAVALTTLVAVAACGTGIHLAGRRAVYLQHVSDLDRHALLVREWVPKDGKLGDAERARINDLARALATRVTLIDGGGRIVLDTDASANLMDNHNHRPEVVAARASGMGHDSRRSGTIGEDSVYVARPLDPARPDGLVVRVSHWQEGAAATAPPPPHAVTSLLAVAGAATFSALAAGAVTWVLLRRHWVAPLRDVSDVAEHLAHGEWHRRAHPAGTEDVRVLAGQLNQLAAHAQRQQAEAAHGLADLQVLAGTIADAVLVSDAQDRVTLINPAAAALLDVKPEKATGQKLVNVVGDADVLALLESVRRLPPPSSPPAQPGDGRFAAARAEHLPPREIRLVRDGQHLTFHAHAQRTAGGGVLMVLRDVSTHSGAVQMKADFVANASHELRTPIAAIKIAFETLRDVYGEDPQQTERCLAIIEGHMNRLEEMLRDLLDLSRVESAEIKPYLRELSSAELFASLRATMGSLARQKGVELRMDDDGDDDGDGADGEPVRFASDERLLNLVLKNLVENSIKFTPAGGTVTVTIAETPPASGDARGELQLTVADTGIGVPPEHLDRVFERFYQVDAARSGSAGRGTGLGLAIVKHAVHALGGTIELRSAVGRGTTVTCTLPQDVLAEQAGTPAANAT